MSFNKIAHGLLLGCASFALLTLTVPDVIASWADSPLEEVISGSPVVVVGSIDCIKSADSPQQSQDYRYDTAYIAVSQVLKNTLPDFQIQTEDKIPLSMPAAANPIRISTDIYYKVGTHGVWILERREGTFWATYPKDFQPLSQEQKVKAIIQQQN